MFFKQISEFLLSSRIADSDDLPFFYALYANSRFEEVSAFGWNEDQQHAFLNMQFAARQYAYRMQYPGAEDRVVLFQDERAGRLIIDSSKDLIVIVDIAVSQAFRRRGIASQVIESLQDLAGETGRGILLRVDKSNRPACELYRKLGFNVESENQIIYSMLWTRNDPE